MKIKEKRRLANAFFLCIGLILLFSSCNTSETSEVTFLKEINFNTPVGSDCPNIYYDKGLKQELIYFIDQTVEKNIKFFSTAGVLIRTTPLGDVLKNIDNVGGIAVVSADTLIINSNYTNQILFVNRLGKVWKNYSMENKLIDSLGNQYEIISSYYTTTQDPNSFIYGLMWRNNLNDLETKKIPKTDLEYLRYFNKRSVEGAYLVNIQYFLSAQPLIKFKGYGLKKEFDTPSIVSEIPAYFPTKNTIFISSLYSDAISKVNKNNFENEGKIKLSSAYTSLGTNPIKINSSVLGKIQDSITYKQKCCGRIEKMLFNDKRQEYYVLVRHNTTVKIYDRDTVPFSILVLNKNLSKKSEVYFAGSKYKYYYTLLCSDGLLLFKNDTTKSLIKNEKVTYTLFNFL